MDSLADIFYNTVPGALLLAALAFIVYNDEFLIQFDNPIGALIFIAVSVLVGFILQIATSFLRKKLNFLDEERFSKVLSDNSKIYKLAEAYLSKNKLLKRGHKRQDVFYTMDNYIRSHVNEDIVKTFNARMSFWSNISLAAFISCLLYFKFNELLEGRLFFTLSIIAFLGYRENFRRTYDVILQTFWSTLVIDKKVK